MSPLLLNYSEVQAAHLAHLIKKIDKQNSDLLQSLAVALFAYFTSPHPTVPHCKCLLRVTASRFEGHPILTLPFFVRIKEVKILSGALRAGI